MSGHRRQDQVIRYNIHARMLALKISALLLVRYVFFDLQKAGYIRGSLSKETKTMNLLSPAEAAQLIGCTPTVLALWSRSKRPDRPNGIRVGSRWVYPKDEVEAYARKKGKLKDE